jgi:hypothetical protein
MTQSYCGKCGYAVQSDDLFCRKCGSPTNSEIVAKEDTKPRMPIPKQDSQLIPQVSPDQQSVVIEKENIAGINQPMKYFSQDNQYVNAECQNCGRVLKISREKCATILGGLSVNPAVICQCGTTSDFIGDVSSDYRKSTGGTKTSSDLNIQLRQPNSTVQFADFIWKPSNRVYTSLSSNANADAAIARENWWQQARSEIMNELQPYMIEGWQPITAPGADCWQCKTYKEPVTKNWTAVGWIIYLIALFLFAFIPIIVLAFNNDYYEIVAFRVQLRRAVR